MYVSLKKKPAFRIRSETLQQKIPKCYLGSSSVEDPDPFHFTFRIRFNETEPEPALQNQKS